jgi:hypothetical protein
MKFQCQQSGPVPSVENEEHLSRLLNAAAKQAAADRLTAVNLYAENGDALTIVLGGTQTVLSFTYGHGNPPYFASLGVADEIEPVLTCYLFNSHHSEFPRRNVIPIESGLAAAQEFFKTKELPRQVEWEEV